MIIFSFHCSAEDMKEKANQSYFQLLSYIEKAKNQDLSLLTRQESIANIVNQITPGAGSNWITIKDGLFDIMTEDPNFFFDVMLNYPDQLETIMENFSLNWLYKGESKYPEKKQLALKALKIYLEREKKKQKNASNFYKIIEKTKPSVLH